MSDLVFFDSTAFIPRNALEAVAWKKIAEAIDQDLLKATVSEVTVQEVSRHYSDEIRGLLREIDKSHRGLLSFGIVSSLPSVPSADNVSRIFPEWLDSVGIQQTPVAAIPHDVIVKRDLGGVPPFDKKGRGYRDTLIWLTFIDWLESNSAALGGSGIAYFVSANSRDFAFGEDSFAPPLCEEIPKGVRVEIVRSPSIFGSKITLHTPLDLHARILEYAIAFVEKALYLRDIEEELPDRLHVIESPSVTEVYVTHGEVRCVEEVDDDRQASWWEAEMPVELGVTGYVHKSEAYSGDELFNVVDYDWNESFAEVHMDLSALVIVSVYVEDDDDIDNGIIEAVDIDNP